MPRPNPPLNRSRFAQSPLIAAAGAYPDPASLVPFAILRSAGLLANLIARSLAPLRLHHAQLAALLLLRRHARTGLRPSALGRMLSVSRPNVTKMLARLSERKLVEQRPDPADARAVLAFATAASAEVSELGLQAVRRVIAGVTTGLSPSQAASVNELLRELDRAALVAIEGVAAS
jgi:DNA-binding MarR family transcriptional regulator